MEDSMHQPGPTPDASGAFTRLIVDVSTALAAATASTVDDAILAALATLGRAVAADRAYVFRLRDDGVLVDNTHEWCATGIPEEAHRLQGISIDTDMPWFGTCMRRDEVFHVPRVADLPEEAALERAEFESESIRSLVVVPMFRRGSLAGFLGFDAVRTERRWSEDDIALLRVTGHNVLLALDRAAVEAALSRSEDRFRSLVEHTSDWVWEVDLDGRYTYASPKVQDLLGHAAANVEGRSAFDFMPPDEAERIRREFATAVAMGAPIRALENRLLHADGHEVWIETSGVPIFDESGKLVGYRGIDRDITWRKVLERDRAMVDQALREREKLESLGLLAGGIAHDFNNLLTAMLGQASLVRMALGHGASPHPALRHIALLEGAAVRATELTAQLLAYAGKTPLSFAPVDVGRLIAELEPLLRMSVSERCKLELVHRGPPARVRGDASQLGQIVMNLVRNASDALGEAGGTIRVHTGTSTLDAPPARSFLAGGPGRPLACLSVSDDGPGISPEVVERVFEPFFTTKPTGQGLGLAATLGILKAHRGAIDIDTVPGGGTSFRVMLPLATPDDTRAPPPERGADARCVLVVDDEPMVRTVASEALALNGARCLFARDGREALAVHAEHADAIDLVLLDMTMPGPSTAEVLAGMRFRQPGVRVLLMSGNVAADPALGLADLGAVGFLHKPFRIAQLLEAVDRAANTAAAPGNTP